MFYVEDSGGHRTVEKVIDLGMGEDVVLIKSGDGMWERRKEMI